MTCGKDNLVEAIKAIDPIKDGLKIVKLFEVLELSQDQLREVYDHWKNNKICICEEITVLLQNKSIWGCTPTPGPPICDKNHVFHWDGCKCVSRDPLVEVIKLLSPTTHWKQILAVLDSGKLSEEHCQELGRYLKNTCVHYKLGERCIEKSPCGPPGSLFPWEDCDTVHCYPCKHLMAGLKDLDPAKNVVTILRGLQLMSENRAALKEIHDYWRDNKMCLHREIAYFFRTGPGKDVWEGPVGACSHDIGKWHWKGCDWEKCNREHEF